MYFFFPVASRSCMNDGMMMVSFWLPTTMKITQPEVYASTAWAKMDMTIDYVFMRHET